MVLHRKLMLRVASCMAPSADEMCRDLVEYLKLALGMHVELVDTVAWRERERMLETGEIDLCWICGLPYVQKVDAGHGIEPCVAPVMPAKRYQGRPIYFSELIVRADSPYTSFTDFRGEAWVFNEPRSHSGFNVICHYLATQRLTLDYFARLVEAGAHQVALELILAGEVAAGAIDSTVLEAELRRRPSLAGRLRSVGTLGPSPAPPWVFSAKVPPELRRRVTQCLAGMHHTNTGAAVLAGWGIAELGPVADRTYDPIREMARIGASATVGTKPRLG